MQRGARSEVSVPNDVGQHILDALNREKSLPTMPSRGADLPVSLFDEAQNAVFNLMRLDSVPRFLQSSMFRNATAILDSA